MLELPMSMCIRCSRDSLSTCGTESRLGVTKPSGNCWCTDSSGMSARRLIAVINTSSRLGLRSQHCSFCRRILVLSGHQLIWDRVSRSRSSRQATSSFQVSCKASWRIRLRITLQYFHCSNIAPFFMCFATWSQRSSHPMLTSLHLSKPQPNTLLGRSVIPISVKDGRGRPEW
jgi:hypothetical protein